MKETLTSRKDIRELFQTGRRVSTFPITLVFKENGSDQNRYLYCPERSVRLAVHRNRIKRRLRAAISDLEPEMNQGFDLAILAKPKLLEIGYPELLSCLGSLLAKVR
ncbi:ribonuclease P protein component [Leptospira perolatii]|uniref:Ribonuclease P protein component n=1 Tax=Leptospira perolatii TaxID=2023191 RepID=A0A2M9ZKW3_9LEPT|nr:ribonuclease P protein component [Leptospira perolatii]PJZ69971.1 ribonuclease P protein component [Leptospira perolatii]PJZ72621.1 ribonuclease P protein component [Leptospira perolatii]